MYASCLGFNGNKKFAELVVPVGLVKNVMKLASRSEVGSRSCPLCKELSEPTDNLERAKK